MHLYCDEGHVTGTFNINPTFGSVFGHHRHFDITVPVGGCPQRILIPLEDEGVISHFLS